MEGVDEREAITRFTRGNTLLTFTGERNPPNAPPRLIPARLVPIRKFYGKYDTWGNTVEMHLALCTPPNHRAFIKEEKERKFSGMICVYTSYIAARKRIIKAPLCLERGYPRGMGIMATLVVGRNKLRVACNTTTFSGPFTL